MNVLRKVLALLSRRRRWHLALLFVSTLVMGIMSTVGVVSILPFMAVLANPEVVFENRWLAMAYETLGFTSVSGFLFGLGLLTLTVIALSNAVNALHAWMIARFTHGLNDDLSRRLLATYLAQSYAFYLTRNTSGFAKNVLAEVSAVATGLVAPLVQAIGKAVVACFILALLIHVDVLLAFIVGGVLGILYGAVYLGVRRRQARLGREKVEANAGRFRAASEAFGGIKDVKVLGREAHFLRRFSGPSREYARTQASHHIIGHVPGYALEIVAFGGILIIVLYLMQTYENLGQILPVVSLYAFAAYRLKPAFQEIFFSLTKVKYNIAPLDDLYADLVGNRLEQERELSEADLRDWAADSAEPLPAVEFTEEIRVADVSFRYPGSGEEALRGISLVIPKNCAIGLVGQTGSGKTTLADLLLGLFEPTRGRILVDGEPLTGKRLLAWRRAVGYVPQQIFLADDTIRRNIAFGIPSEEIDEDRVRRAASVAHLDEFVERLPHGFDTVVGERGIRLSGGQRQRIGIARALYDDPEVLILDEATSALDNITENAVLDAIRDLYGSKTMIVVAHRISTVEACDRIVVLSRGEVIAEGPYATLLQDHSAFRALAGIEDSPLVGKASRVANA